MKISKSVILCLFLIAAMPLAFAVNEQGNSAGETAAAEKKATFGQCVSEAAAIKNACHQSVKDALASCKAIDAGQAEKPAKKECRAAYKTSKKNCKADFMAKKTECRKIKHTFMESVRASFQ